MATALSYDRSYHGSDLARVREVEAGLPVSALRAMLSDGVVALSDLVGIVGSRRTLDRRLAANGTLSPDESDRLDRFAEVLALAVHIFGSRAKAIEWLRTPKCRFEGARPLDLMRTHSGTQAVINFFRLAQHGMLA